MKKNKAFILIAVVAMLVGGAVFAARYTCSSCGGRGRVTCTACGGSGRTRAGMSSWEQSTGNCGICHGTGQVACHSCNGSGVIYR